MRTEREVLQKLEVKRADYDAAVSELEEYERMHRTAPDYWQNREKLKRRADACLFGMKAIEWVLEVDDGKK